MEKKLLEAKHFFFSSTCIFCGDKNEKFVKEGLELHYWKVCAMLKRCEKCKQVNESFRPQFHQMVRLLFYFKVIEIAAQTEHLLTECEFKSNYKKCPRCTEAVPQTDNDFHFKQKQCIPFSGDGNRCPLCHTNIPAGEDGWKDHLMTNGCTKNPRKTSVQNNADAKKAKK